MYNSDSYNIDISDMDSDDYFLESYDLSELFTVVKRDDLISSNKIILPASVLKGLYDWNPTYPLTFRIENPKTKSYTFCGVKEFTATEGTCILSSSIIENLGLSTKKNEKSNKGYNNKSHSSINDYGKSKTVCIYYYPLKIASFVKLKPYTNSFYKIEDPKAVLERELSTFICLNEGEDINISFDGETFPLLVEELQPEKHAIINEIELKVDFSTSFENDEIERRNQNEKRVSKVMSEEERKKQLEKSKNSFLFKEGKEKMDRNNFGNENMVEGKRYSLIENIDLEMGMESETITENSNYNSKDLIVKEVSGDFVFHYKIDGKGNRRLIKREEVNRDINSEIGSAMGEKSEYNNNNKTDYNENNKTRKENQKGKSYRLI